MLETPKELLKIFLIKQLNNELKIKVFQEWYFCLLKSTHGNSFEISNSIWTLQISTLY